MGTSILAAQYYGKNDMNSIEKIFAYVTKVSFLISSAFFLISFFAPEMLMRDFHTGATINSGWCRISATCCSILYIYWNITNLSLHIEKYRFCCKKYGYWINFCDYQHFL